MNKRTFSASMVTQFAQQEQSMNAVERVLVYTELPAEDDGTIPGEQPPASWPEQGMIKFTNVELAYRKDLPLVLKNVSFSINPGEKVSILLFKSSVAHLPFSVRLE